MVQIFTRQNASQIEWGRNSQEDGAAVDAFNACDVLTKPIVARRPSPRKGNRSHESKKAGKFSDVRNGSGVYANYVGDWLQSRHDWVWLQLSALAEWQTIGRPRSRPFNYPIKPVPFDVGVCKLKV